MTCFIARNLLSELVDGVLDPARAHEMEEHLAGCKECSRELEALRRVRAQLRALPMRRAPGDFYAKVMAKAEKKSVLERVTKALSVLWHLPAPAKAGVAFAASLVLVVTVWLNNRPDRDLWSLGAAPGAKTAERSVDESSRVAALGDRQEEKPKTSASGEAGADVPARDLAVAQAAASSTPAPASVSAAAPAPTVARMAAPQADRRKDEAQSTLALKAEGRGATAPGGATGGLVAPAVSGGYGKNVVTERESPNDDGAVGGEKKKETRSAPPPPPPPVAVSHGAVGPRATPVEPGLYATVPAGQPAPVSANGSETSATRSLAKGEASGKAAKMRAGGAAAPDTGTTATGADAAMPVLEEPAMKAPRSAEPAFDSMASGDVSGGSAGGGGSSAGAPAEESKRDADKVTSDVESASTNAHTAATPTPVTLHARFTVDSMSGPADVLSAASEVGATPVSTNPPALAKSGAYTIVVVDVPGGKWPALAEKLNAAGTLELLVDPPTHRTRMRIEVIRR